MFDGSRLVRTIFQRLALPSLAAPMWPAFVLPSVPGCSYHSSAEFLRVTEKSALRDRPFLRRRVRAPRFRYNTSVIGRIRVNVSCIVQSDAKESDSSVEERRDRARHNCPKHMVQGPCAGVTAAGSCEFDDAIHCPFVYTAPGQTDSPLFQDLYSWTEITEALKKTPLNYAKRPHGTESVRGGRLGAELQRGSFPVVVEALPPLGISGMNKWVSKYVTLAAAVGPEAIAAFGLPQQPMGNRARVGSLAAGALLQRETAIDAMPHLTCRHRDAAALEGELLDAAAVGFPTVLCVTGDHPATGLKFRGLAQQHPQVATAERGAIFHLDSFSLISLAREMRDDRHVVDLMVGAAASPCGPPGPQFRARRIAAKVCAGADFVMTQPALDLAAFGAFMDELEAHQVLEHTHVIVGVPLITSRSAAERFALWSPSAHLFYDYSDAASPAQFRARAFDRTLRLLDTLRERRGVDGVLIYDMTAPSDDRSLVDLIATLRS